MPTVSEVFNVKRIVGAVAGVELEVEGKRLPPAPPQWTQVADGSLRNGTEYVLTEPLTATGIKEALEAIQDAFVKSKTETAYSFRTSTHIHLNVSNLELAQVQSIVMLWYLFEDTYTRFCDPSRVGNRFCLRLIDAEVINGHLRRFIGNGNLPSNEHGKYCALNIVPVGRQGTLEIRCLEGTNDWNKIYQWVRILLRLRKAGKELISFKEIYNTPPNKLAELLFPFAAQKALFLKEGWEQEVEYRRSLLLDVFHAHKEMK